ncbi:hypothetical protein LR48_Vigan02g031700 [Vigna angularis]|uniref:Uncharacterized protein n=1 Tax=Phaseolus angularis TaxID=3914 RepID=A0A0L9TUU4_PHAAN|nr:hypothetical protein LR48_Vigan02g031700 [Vigna angularis]
MMAVENTSSLVEDGPAPCKKQLIQQREATLPWSSKPKVKSLSRLERDIRWHSLAGGKRGFIHFLEGYHVVTVLSEEAMQQAGRRDGGYGLVKGMVIAYNHAHPERMGAATDSSHGGEEWCATRRREEKGAGTCCNSCNVIEGEAMILEWKHMQEHHVQPHLEAHVEWRRSRFCLHIKRSYRSLEWVTRLKGISESLSKKTNMETLILFSHGNKLGDAHGRRLLFREFGYK